MPGTLIGEDDSPFDDRGVVATPDGPSAIVDLDSAVLQPSAPAPAATEEDALVGDDVPEKYRNKSARELLDIVTNQESVIGRHGQELGDLRARNGTLEGLVDKSLQLRDSGDVGRRVQDEETALTDADFTINPREATARTVESELASRDDRLNRLEHTARSSQFLVTHPTAEADMADPDFVDFVKGSSTRQKLALRSFSDRDNIDFDAAEELWALYDDFTSMKPSPAAPATEPGKEGEPTEPTETANASQQASEDPPELISQGGGTGPGTAGKPIYSQTALNRLQLEKPTEYWAKDTQDRIDLARAEGRITD